MKNIFYIKMDIYRVWNVSYIVMSSTILNIIALSVFNMVDDIPHEASISVLLTLSFFINIIVILKYYINRNNNYKYKFVLFTWFIKYPQIFEKITLSDRTSYNGRKTVRTHNLSDHYEIYNLINDDDILDELFLYFMDLIEYKIPHVYVQTGGKKRIHELDKFIKYINKNTDLLTFHTL